MMINKQVFPLKQLAAIMLGAAIFAFGLHYFIIPNKLMEGGLTGISLLLLYAFSLPPSVTTLLMNIPLLLLGWRYMGHRRMIFTMYGTLSLSLFLWLMEFVIDRGWIVPLVNPEDYFLVTLYAGVTIGFGLGIVFRFGGTTGGIDIIAFLGSKWWKLSMGQIILILDASVIGLSLFFIPKEKVLYTIVAVFVASRMIDFITEGAYEARAFSIITHKGQAVCEAITRELERGSTLIPAKGGFSFEHKELVYCIVSRQEIGRLKDVVKAADPHAFIIISNVHDVLGQGFERE